MPTKEERKKWLLHLWDYHTNLLTDAERAEVDRKREEEISARIDSDRVRELIEELRQAGRWETHPTFPEEMVDRILQKEGSGKGRLIFAAVLLIAAILLFLFRGEAPQPEVGVAPEQAEGLSLVLPAAEAENGERDFSALEQGVEEDLAFTSELRFGITTDRSPQGGRSASEDGLELPPPPSHFEEQGR